MSLREAWRRSNTNPRRGRLLRFARNDMYGGDTGRHLGLAPLSACVSRLIGTGGESGRPDMMPSRTHRTPPDLALGSLASVAGSGPQTPCIAFGSPSRGRYIASGALPQPPSRYNPSLPPDTIGQAPRRYPQSEERSIIGSGEADKLPSRRRGRRTGHAPPPSQHRLRVLSARCIIFANE